MRQRGRSIQNTKADKKDNLLKTNVNNTVNF